MSDMRRLLETVNKFAGEPEQKPGDQVRGGEPMPRRGTKKHPHAGRLVGGESILRELEKQIVEGNVERRLREEFSSVDRKTAADFPPVNEFAPPGATQQAQTAGNAIKKYMPAATKFAANTVRQMKGQDPTKDPSYAKLSPAQQQQYVQAQKTIDATDADELEKFDANQAAANVQGMAKTVVNPANMPDVNLKSNVVDRKTAADFPPVNEFAPPGGDDREPDEEEILRQLAAQWWNGTEQQMAKAQRTLAAMGWEIGQDESGDDDAGVFLIRPGDVDGDTYIAFPHSELGLQEWGAAGTAVGPGNDDADPMEIAAQRAQQVAGKSEQQNQLAGLIGQVNGARSQLADLSSQFPQGANPVEKAMSLQQQQAQRVQLGRQIEDLMTQVAAIRSQA